VHSEIVKRSHGVIPLSFGKGGLLAKPAEGVRVVNLSTRWKAEQTGGLKARPYEPMERAVDSCPYYTNPLHNCNESPNP